MKITYGLIFALVIMGAALFLLQLWFSFLTPDIFVKLIITLGILLVVLGVAILIRKDVAEENDLKKDKFIN